MIILPIKKEGTSITEVPLKIYVLYISDRLIFLHLDIIKTAQDTITIY